jgi:toxin ParE1/3/4
VSHYVLSPRARIDIQDIYDYSAATWGIEQAEDYIRLLQSAIETVAEEPRRGRPCDELRRGYRKYAVGSHVLFYRAVDAGVDVVRILHGGMDFEQHL